MEDKHEYTAAFHFLKGVLTGNDFADLISDGLGFRPTFINATPPCGRNGRCKIEDRLRKIRGTDKIERLELRISKDYSQTPRFWYSTFPFYDITVLDLKHEELSAFEPVLERLVQLPGFTTGFIHDSSDSYWQNERLASNYEWAGVAYDHLPTEDVSPFAFVDTRPNPGHRLDLPGTRLTAAWRMWFSSLADRFFPTERLPQFAEATSVREFNNGIFEVELYEDGTSYATELARKRQMKFRDFIEFNVLIGAAPELLMEASDPVYEIHNGEVDGDPALVLITWMNDSKNHVPRGKATRRRIALQRKGGESLWSCIETKPFSEIVFSPTPPTKPAESGSRESLTPSPHTTGHTDP